MIRFCEICDCKPANNKCTNCEFNNICDYVWVSDIWKRNSDLLTPLMPGWVKPEFTNKNIITVTGNSDFCIFHIPKRTDTITIQDICVDESARGKGVSRTIINYLMETYDRDIIAKCVSGSSAESFWNHVGEKIGTEPSKQRYLSIYRVNNNNKKHFKIDLF